MCFHTPETYLKHADGQTCETVYEIEEIEVQQSLERISNDSNLTVEKKVTNIRRENSLSGVSEGG